jgi:hypothetical protein
MAFGIPVGMKWTAAAAPALILSWITVPSRAQAPLSNPAILNIGLVCRWDDHCMTVQRKAMTHALGYVRHERPPASRVQLCNRNARRGYQRVDWIGFDHCIRNQRLGRAAAADARRKSHR